MLTGTAGAGYPPLLYALHAGAQTAIGAPMNDPVAPRLGAVSNYWEPQQVATQLVLAAAHLAGLAALLIAGRPLVGERGAWALVALYASSVYLLQVGGTRESVSGLSFVSHIVPASATLVAFACLAHPALSGGLLAAAVGLGFYPAFFLPIWAAWHWQRGRWAGLEFTACFAGVAVATVAWVLAWSVPGAWLQPCRDDRSGHPRTSRQSAWLWSQPLRSVGTADGNGRLAGTSARRSSPLTTPFFIVFIISIAVAAHLARRADVPRLALLTAGAAIGANLWKIHATATYVSWYYPFLLLGLLAVEKSPRERSAQEGA